VTTPKDSNILSEFRHNFVLSTDAGRLVLQNAKGLRIILKKGETMESAKVLQDFFNQSVDEIVLGK